MRKRIIIHQAVFKKSISLGVIFSLMILRCFSQVAVDSGYAPVNGLRMYYEIHGTGEPLVLIHGGVGAIEMFGSNLTTLAKTRKVIGVDLQAHGKTADINRPLSIESMADDIAALLKYLKIERADVMGYSLGGEVALQTVIRHPQVVRKLVVVSATFKRNGWYAEILAGMEQMGPAAAEPMKQTPMYQLYSSIAPKPQDWPVLITKLGKLLQQDYDWSDGVKEIKSPVLLIAGDADAVRTAHIIEFYGLLGGGQKDAGWDGSQRPDAPACYSSQLNPLYYFHVAGDGINRNFFSRFANAEKINDYTVYNLLFQTIKSRIMEKKEFKITISAPREKVWSILWGEATYPEWTSVFAEGSTVKTDNWKKGSKVLFLAGKGSGMVSTIAENIPNEFMSFKHLGTVKDGVEDQGSSDEWAGALENYTLKKMNGKTELTVDMDISEEYMDYFLKTWLNALEKVKELAEGK